MITKLVHYLSAIRLSKSGVTSNFTSLQKYQGNFLTFNVQNVQSMKLKMFTNIFIFLRKKNVSKWRDSDVSCKLANNTNLENEALYQNFCKIVLNFPTDLKKSYVLPFFLSFKKI